MKAVSRYTRRKQEVKKTSEVVAIVLTCFCYVLYRRYNWTTETLQSIIDEVGNMIIEADRNVDWSVGLKFWRDRMGLKM